MNRFWVFVFKIFFYPLALFLFYYNNLPDLGNVDNTLKATINHHLIEEIFPLGT